VDSNSSGNIPSDSCSDLDNITTGPNLEVNNNDFSLNELTPITRLSEELDITFPESDIHDN